MPFVRHELGRDAADQAHPGPARPARRHRRAGHARPAAAQRARARATAPEGDLPARRDRCRRRWPRVPPRGRRARRAAVRGRSRRKPRPRRRDGPEPGGTPGRKRAEAAPAKRADDAIDLAAVPRRRARTPSSSGCAAPGACSPSATRTPMPTRSGRRSAIVRIVEALGGTADPVCTDPVAAAVRLPAGRRARSATDPDPAAAYDLLVVSDCGSLDRIGAVARPPRASCSSGCRASSSTTTPRTTRPATPTGSTRRRRDLRDGRAARGRGWASRSTPATGRWPTALMAGIVMDTATFAHPNATPRTLAVSAALVEAGAPLSDISRRLYRIEAGRPAPAVRPRARSARDAPTTGASSGRRCSTRTSPRPAREPPHSEGIIDLLAQAEEAEVAILFKEAGEATRISVRTQARRRGRHGPDRARSAAAGTPARPARPSSCPSTEARPAVLAEASASPPRSRADAWPTSRSAPASTASSSSTSRSARPRTTSSASSAGSRRPSGSATAARSIRSRPASCRCSSAGHARRRVPPRRSQALPRDGLLRRLVHDGRPRGRADARPTARRRRASAVEAALAGVHGPDLAAPAGLLGDQGRRPAGLRDGPRRRDASSWRSARSTIHALDARRRGTTRDPDRPIAILDVACSAGTYVRALARDLGERLGSARLPRRAAADGSGPVRLEARCAPARRRSAPRRADGPEPLIAAAPPDRHGPGALPRRRADARRDRRGRPRPVRPARRRASRPARSAIDCGRRTATLAAVAIEAPGRPAGPGQGPVVPRTPGRRPPPAARGRDGRRHRGRRAAAPSTGRSSRSSASSTACIAATPTCSTTSSAKRARPRRPPDRHHVRRTTRTRS